MMPVQAQTEPSASRSSADLQLVLRHPADARHLTEQQLGWLSLSLRGDPRVSLQGLLMDIAVEAAQLWSVEVSGDVLLLIVSRIVHYELCDAFEIQLCGGRRMRECLELLPELEKHAKALGCKLVELRGRPGWQRLLPQYEMRGVALEKGI